MKEVLINANLRVKKQRICSTNAHLRYVVYMCMRYAHEDSGKQHE